MPTGHIGARSRLSQVRHPLFKCASVSEKTNEMFLIRSLKAMSVKEVVIGCAFDPTQVLSLSIKQIICLPVKANQKQLYETSLQVATDPP